MALLAAVARPLTLLPERSLLGVYGGGRGWRPRENGAFLTSNCLFPPSHDAEDRGRVKDYG